MAARVARFACSSVPSIVAPAAAAWPPPPSFLHTSVAFTRGPVLLARDSRFADGDLGDQVRIMTPAKARKASDYIVVGRPITAAADPVAAYERCVKEFLG